MKNTNVSVLDRRKCYLSNIQLIGELFHLQMLSESNIHSYFSYFLKFISDEEKVEEFCKLLTVVGKNLNKESAQVRMNVCNILALFI